MLYQVNVTVPANTAESSPVETRLQCTVGLIYQAGWYFPPGSCGLLRARIFDGPYSLYPSSPDASINGNNLMRDFPEHYEITSTNAELTILAWNLDTDYAHYFDFWVHVASSPSERSQFDTYAENEKLREMIESIMTQKLQSTKTAARTALDAVKRIAGRR